MRLMRINKTQEILHTDSEGLNGLIETAKSKSELAGIECVLNWPALQIETLEMNLAQVIAAMQEEQDDDTTE